MPKIRRRHTRSGFFGQASTRERTLVPKHVLDGIAAQAHMITRGLGGQLRMVRAIAQARSGRPFYRN